MDLIKSEPMLKKTRAMTPIKAIVNKTKKVFLKTSILYNYQSIVKIPSTDHYIQVYIIYFLELLSIILKVLKKYINPSFILFFIILTIGLALVIGGFILAFTFSKPETSYIVAAKVLGLRETECQDNNQVTQSCLIPIIEFEDSLGKPNITELNAYSEGLDLLTRYEPGESIALRINSNDPNNVEVLTSKSTENSKEFSLNILGYFFIALGLVLLGYMILNIKNVFLALNILINPGYVKSSEQSNNQDDTVDYENLENPSNLSQKSYKNIDKTTKKKL